MADKSIKIPGPDHPISIEANSVSRRRSKSAEKLSPTQAMR